MAYFARKLRYGAHDGESGAQFMAFIELAKKKGGKPVEFILYRYIVQYDHPAENVARMIRFKTSTSEEAVRRFWPWDDGMGKEFPGWESERWEKTTLWLYHVAVGGSYERVSPEVWTRVSTPSPWKRRHRKKPLQFGNLHHRLLVLNAERSSLENERSGLEEERLGLEVWVDGEGWNRFVPPEDMEEYDSLTEAIEELASKVADVDALIAATMAEMRFKVYKMFPEPAGLTPKRLLREMEIGKRR